MNPDGFMSLVQENLELEGLTPKIVNEFIGHIIVCTPGKPSGKRTQKVKIIYNLIGDVPKYVRKMA